MKKTAFLNVNKKPSCQISNAPLSSYSCLTSPRPQQALLQVDLRAVLGFPAQDDLVGEAFGLGKEVV